MRFIKKIILSFVFIFILIFNCFAESSIIRNSAFNNTNIGPASLIHTLAITGDSYAGLFIDYEKNHETPFDGFAIAGKTVLENKDIMISAINSKDKIIVISIGVNDHMNQTDLVTFQALINELIANAIKKDKTLIFHSYVDYPLSVSVPGIIKCAHYDYILQNLAKLYDNVHYIDINEYAVKENISEDGIHYNKLFYDALYKKVMDFVNNL